MVVVAAAAEVVVVTVEVEVVAEEVIETEIDPIVDRVHIKEQLPYQTSN